MPGGVWEDVPKLSFTTDYTEYMQINVISYQ